MSEIIIISGSPSDTSKTKKILDYLGTIVEREGFSINHVSVRDISKEVLFEGAYDSPEIRKIVTLIQNAKGVIIGSPVYKGAYSGILKTLIDVLPQDVLKHKPVLPLMTGGSSTHLLALEYTLKPVLASLKAHNLKGLYFLDAQIDKQKEIPIIDEDTLKRTKKQLDYFIKLAKHEAEIKFSEF